MAERHNRLLESSRGFSCLLLVLNPWLGPCCQHTFDQTQDLDLFDNTGLLLLSIGPLTLASKWVSWNWIWILCEFQSNNALSRASRADRLT